MFFSEIKKLDKQYVANTYARNDLDASSGTGAVCVDGSGKKYIDFTSGIGVNSLGFTNPAWVDAVKSQLDNLAHISNLFYTTPQMQLAKLLCEKTGMCRVFFGNSGAEANEGAIKTARKYGSDKYGPQRNEIITLVNSFHGRTIATLAATGQDVFHKNFGPFPEGFVYANANDIADLQAKVSDKTCAIMIECVQGEGGIIPLEKSFTNAIAAICAEKDILLVIDEVQTGVGRTGKFLSCEHYGLRPDIVTLAKGLGGGLPIGAVLFGEKTKDTLGLSDHGSTFGGNPVVCAGAIEVIKAMDGKFLDSVAETGAYLAESLKKLDHVKGVTGKGLMLGVEPADGLVAGSIVKTGIKHGIFLLTAKSKVRFLPPLTISKDEIDSGLAILQEVLNKEMQALEAAQKETAQ
ncbi:aspartate aminotransferase family protein [Ruminococcaceae bacterium OttesenSCG-928-L11]|nr:aspartate aminotransferase family protein [Ruminococcaceae bacterium OttesenSCG-928-L11]